jgi:hypothetical protein
MTAFEARHYAVRFRYSQRLRYRIPRMLWQGLSWLSRVLARGLASVGRKSEKSGGAFTDPS